MASSTMMSGGGDIVDMKQIMFTNLQTLGLDSHAMEKAWRIPFNKEMFDLPNKKGFEAVMYFLFERLNPTRCKEEFRYCWKVQDKKDEAQFRKICFNWLTEIQEKEDAQLPRFVQSVFMSPGGQRFIHLLLHVSRYVLQACIATETSLRGVLLMPAVTARNISVVGEVSEASLQCAAVRHRQRFLQHAQQAACTQDAWAMYAGEVVRRYRGLQRTVRELEHDLRTEVQRAVEKGKARGCSVAHTKRRSGGLEYDFDVEAVKRAQKIRKVRDLWQRLSQFRTGLSGEREVVASVLEGEQEKYRIDGTELNVKVPERLLREQHKELMRRNVENVYQGGKLNLQSLVQLCNISLHLYLQKFDSHGVPNFTDMESPLTTQVHTHNAHLSNAQALRMRIEGEMIPHLKQSIEQLKRKLDQQMLQSQSPNSIPLASIGLGLLPPTPPVSFEPGPMNTSMEERIKTQIRQPQFDSTSTPEAASELMAAIDGKVRRQALLTQASPNVPQPSNIPTKQRSRIPSAPADLKHTRHKASPVVHSTLQDISERASKPTVPGARKKVKQNLTAQSVNLKPRHAETVVNKAVKRKTSKKTSPIVEKHENIIASSVASPAGHNRLADQITEAMLSDREDLAAQLTEQLRKPATLLGEEAFVSRCKLQHSPEADRLTETSSHGWQVTGRDSVGPLSSTHLQGEQHSPQHSPHDSDEPITPSKSPKSQSSTGKSPKADLYHPVAASHQSPHSGFSTPNKDSPHVPRSPHGSRSRLRSPPRSRSQRSESPFGSDPRNGDLFGSLDDVNDGIDNVGAKRTEDTDMLDLSLVDQDSAKDMSYSGRHVIDSEYLSLMATATPRLPTTRQQHRNNSAADHWDEQSRTSSQTSPRGSPSQAFSLMTMKPSAGRRFAEQSARIVAHTKSRDLSSSRSQTPPEEEDLMRRSLTGESEGDDVARQSSSSDESLNRQTQLLIDRGLTLERRLQDEDDCKDSVDNTSRKSSSSGIDNLIERYRKLRETSGKENQSPSVAHKSSRTNNEVDTLLQRYKDVKQATASPIASPVLDSQYLQCTPVKDKPRNVFALDLDDESEKDVSPAPVTKEWLASGKENRLLGGGFLDEDFSDVLQLSPFQTPTGTPKGTPQKLDSPHTVGLKFSSLPMSPLTDALHREPTTPSSSGRHKPDHWADILGEDPSVLVPSSP